MRTCSVVIPSKSIDLLSRAAGSITRTNVPVRRTRVLVIDDGLAERPRIDGIEYLDGIKPFCFARNVNLGMRAVAPDDVFLMNDDTYLLTPNALAAMEAVINTHPRLGIVTPVFTRPERTPSQRFGRLSPDSGLWIERSGYLTFAGAYIRRELIDAIGCLDETFTDYGYEDNDYCLRAVQEGFDLGVLPSLVMTHGDEYAHASVTFRNNGPFRTNKERFLRKWGANLLDLDGAQCDVLVRLLAFL